jgi:hypothetical protein
MRVARVARPSRRAHHNNTLPRRLERPKVLYNAQRRYYVLLFHVDSLARGRAEVGWAVSVSPTGPFKFEASRCGVRVQRAQAVYRVCRLRCGEAQHRS